MRLQKIELAGKKVMPITIPSGIVTTEPVCAARIFGMIPELGIWSSKSTSPYPKVVPEGTEVENPMPGKQYGYREPIFAKLGQGRFVNAVGLTNPGAKVMREKIIKANIPEDRVKIGCIFGKTASDFVESAKTLEDVVDMLEGNFSCPHSEKEGMALGQDPKIVYDITKQVVNIVKKPFLAKLTPNAEKVKGGIGAIAKAAVLGGAYGIVAINTVGPVKNSYLSFGKGGESGRRIKDIGVIRVREIRQAVGPKIFMLAVGGIFTARDIEEYAEAGANTFGIGSALTGMTDRDIKNYFKSLIIDLENRTDIASQYLQDVNMKYKQVRIEKILNENYDFKVFVTDKSIDALLGQFIFAWLPEIGEKPFSIIDDDPLTLGVLERGYFTKHFNSLKKGDSFYYRGPYGQGVDVPRDSGIVLVGGGCGIAGIYLLAKRFSEKSNVAIFLGAKNQERIVYLREFEKYGKVEIATEDGSLGKKGTVIDLFDDFKIKKGCYFFNCGPKTMVEAVLPLEMEISTPDKIYTSIDYIMRCGVGICGSCVDDFGRRSCVEGPFMNL